MAFLFRTISIATVLLSVTPEAFAQEKIEKADLAFNLETYTTTPRSYAPILGKITLEPRVANLLEGTLHLQIKDAGVIVLQIQIPDLAIAGTVYESAILIPPLPSSGSKGLDVDARFVMAEREIVLSSSDSISNDLSLLITPSFQRGLLVGTVVDGQDDPKTANINFLSEVFKFSRYAEQPKHRQRTSVGGTQFVETKSGNFRTAHATIGPDVVPTDPLSLCSFDILTIADGGLGKLENQQLVAIRKWVRAGGSLCIVPDGVISKRHTSFLTEVLKEHPEPPPMILNDLRELGYDSGVLTTTLGLGRVVILPPNEPLKDRFSFEECRDFAGFLWKVRDEHLDMGEWAFSLPALTEEQLRYGLPAESAVASVAGISEVTEQLMPHNVRMVPLSLVGLLLAAYVFLVGPGDYLLLGLLKARRFTWIVFPLVTAAFTYAMVALSNHYMSTSETGGSITIYDVADSGVAVRRTKLDLDFFAAPRELNEDVKAELVAPLDVRASVYDYQGGGFQFDENGNPVPKRFRQQVLLSGANSYLKGRIPGKYERYRSVKQWQPELTRHFAITDSKAPDLGFDWDDPGEIWTDAGRLALRKAVNNRSSLRDQDIGLRVLHGTEHHVLLRLTRVGLVAQPGPAGYMPEYSDDYLDLITGVSGQTENFFRYVSAISPCGGHNFDDLALIDTSDRNQVLLIASWVEDHNQVIYRRLYKRPQTSQPVESR